MFRLHKHNKSPKLGERLDFHFSHFQAIQVPKGWDKLFVSLIAVETGKTIAKSNKAPVENGICQWTETLSESLWIPQDDSSKYLEECLFKLVISMGSARSGLLGEVTVNMAQYMISTASASVSLPLRKCNFGTILQVQIQCLPPRTRFREEESRYSNSHGEEKDAGTREMGIQSDGSIDSYTRGLKSPSTQDFGSTTHPLHVGSMETNYSASPLYHSFNSATSSMGRKNFSPRTESNGRRFNASVRQDISNSITSSPLQAGNLSISNHSSFNSTVMIGSRDTPSSPAVVRSSLTNMDSSKSLLKTAEDTIEKHKDESNMWERDARKLMLELDITSKKFADQKKRQTDLEMELLASNTERDGLKKEVEQLKKLLKESMARQTASEDSAFRSDRLVLVKKELENELKFQREMNDDLAFQLQRSQESNIELVSVLQELEETIEKQKAEIENLSVIQLKCNDLENLIQGNEEENRNLKESVELLEQELEEKTNKLKNEQNLNSQSLSEMEGKFKSLLSAEEEKVVILEAKLVESEEVVKKHGADLNREIEVLREKVEELERDCNELTDENLELLCNLKVLKSNYADCEVEDFKLRINYLEEELKKKVIKADQILEKNSELFLQIEKAFQQVNNVSFTANCGSDSYVDTSVNIKKIDTTDVESWVESIFHYFVELNNLLEVKIAGNKDEMHEKNDAIEEAQQRLEECNLKIRELEGNLISKEEEIELLRKCMMEIEIQVSDFGNENQRLQEKIEIAEGEREINAKCMYDLRSDLTVLSTIVDSHVSANKVIERKSSELERRKRELELHLFQLEKENVELSELVSTLKSQLKHVADERENSKSVLVGLEDQIGRSRMVIEAQRSDLEEKLKESECMKIEKWELQESNKNLIEERTNLMNINMKLDENRSKLENELGESRVSLFDYSKKVEDLEGKFSLMVEKFSSKEKRLELELEKLVQENSELKEKLIMKERLLDQIYSEKMDEIEALQKEVESLSKSVSESEDGKKRIFELESSLQEANSLACEKMSENEKIAKFLANYRANEEKLKTAVNDLESKVTASEYERQQLIEEMANLKAQLQKMAQFEDDVSGLKRKLKESKSEKEKLEALMKSLRGEHEGVKAEKLILDEKVSSLKRSLSDFEECKKKKVLLEEKLVKMERDLSSKESLQEGDAKNEITRMKRANKQYQRKVQQLENEKDEFSKRIQMLEKDLRLMEATKQDRLKFGGKKSTNQNFDNRRKQSAKASRTREPLEEQQISKETQNQREGESENSFNNGSPLSSGTDTAAKVQLIENELAEALETNNMYKIQLQRLLAEAGNSTSGAGSKKSEVLSTKPSLETELKELQDRYLEMSLKYAEVQAEREDLVMMLKEAKGGKRWFSLNP